MQALDDGLPYLKFIVHFSKFTPEEEQKVVTKQEIKKQFTQNLRDLPIFKNNISHPNIYNLYQEA